MTPDLKPTRDLMPRDLQKRIRKSLPDLLPDLARVAQRFPWSLLVAFVLTFYGLFELQKTLPWSEDIRLVRVPAALTAAFFWSFAATLYAEAKGYEVTHRHGLVVAGYVLMPEHVHLLTNEPRVSSLAVAIQVLKQQTSRQLKGLGQSQFWQRRYYDFNVYTAAKMLEKLKYMHRNPVRRGVAATLEDWPWSSFRHYATDVEGTVEIESDQTARRRELRLETLGRNP